MLCGVVFTQHHSILIASHPRHELFITITVLVFSICSQTSFLRPSSLFLRSHSDMVDELCSGPMLALEIGTGVEEFRVHCGPVDVDIAKSLQPDTIRAKFGTNRIQNAVHCTDLKEDNLDELGYLFDILASGE